jgi:hypothetical protein
MDWICMLNGTAFQIREGVVNEVVCCRMASNYK